MRWHCSPDTGFKIRALAVWGQARYLSVTEAPHNTDFHTRMGKKHFCFFETAETGNQTPNSGVKGSGVNHYTRAPAQKRRTSRIQCSINTNESYILSLKAKIKYLLSFNFQQALTAYWSCTTVHNISVLQFLLLITIIIANNYIPFQHYATNCYKQKHGCPTTIAILDGKDVNKALYGNV